MTKTVWATPNKKNPVDGQKRRSAPDELVICNDPLPERRIQSTKYDEVFNKLKVGQCIKCKPHEANRLASALKKWLTVRNRSDEVKSCTNYGDGMGRVFLVEGVEV